MLYSVPTCREGHIRKLKRRVIRDVKTPVVMQRFAFGRFDVAISDSDEFRDFGAARLVGLQPPELLPVL